MRQLPLTVLLFCGMELTTQTPCCLTFVKDSVAITCEGIKGGFVIDGLKKISNPNQKPPPLKKPKEPKPKLRPKTS